MWNILKAGYIMTALMLISRRLGGWIPVGRARPVAWGYIGTHAFNLAEYITGLKAVEFMR